MPIGGMHSECDKSPMPPVAIVPMSRDGGYSFTSFFLQECCIKRDGTFVLSVNVRRPLYISLLREIDKRWFF